MQVSENQDFTPGISQDTWENSQLSLSPDPLSIFIRVKEEKLDFKSLHGRDGCPVSQSQHCHYYLPATCLQPTCDRELDSPLLIWKGCPWK